MKIQILPVIVFLIDYTRVLEASLAREKNHASHIPYVD